MRVALFAAILLAATPVFAADMTGKVMSYDADSGVIVLEDATEWQVPADMTVPETLAAGATVTMTYEESESEGPTVISELAVE